MVSPSRRRCIAWMLAAPLAAACRPDGGRSTARTTAPGAGASSDTGGASPEDSGPPSTTDLRPLTEAAETLRTDFARAFAGTPFAHLADEVGEAVEAIAEACAAADPVLSTHVQATLTGAVVPAVAWAADLLQRDDLSLDNLQEATAELSTALSAQQAAIASAWAALEADPTHGPQLDTLGPQPEFAEQSDDGLQQLEAWLFTEGAFDIPQVQRVVMMQKWLFGRLHDGVDIDELAALTGPPPPPSSFDIRDCQSFEQADRELGRWLGNSTTDDAWLFYPGHLAMGLMAVSMTMSVMTAGLAAPLMVPLLVAMGNLISLATIAMAAVASSILSVAAACECT